MRLASVLTATAALLPALTQCSTLTPPVLPLIVRNPYLSTWLDNARDVPWSTWPMFWTGQKIGFSVLASVPESAKVYPLLGRPQDSLLPNVDDSGYNVSYPIYRGAKYDASTTNLSYAIPAADGYSPPLELMISFLSPITPSSTVRQAIPAAYMTVYVTGSFDVDVYVDLNGQWVSGDRGNAIVWDLAQSSLAGKRDRLKTWKVKRETEEILTEFSDRSEWGTLHFSAPVDVNHQSGTSAHLRHLFSRTGSLNNSNDNEFRGIMDEEPVFAFSKSFSTSSSPNASISTQSVMFTIAHIQDPVVQFASARGMTMMRPLWKSYFANEEKLLTFHYLDFDNANALAFNYSAQLAIDAWKSGAADYVDIVALSARQVIGATSFSGTPDDPILFLKEISSNGNFQTVDVIFPAFPFFLYTNPKWLIFLLEPLIEHQLSGQYPNTYSMHDLGARFPNATGHSDGYDEYMPVEECGDMLLMALAVVNSMRWDVPVARPSADVATRDHLIQQEVEDGFFPLHYGQNQAMSYLDENVGNGDEGLELAKKWVKRSYLLLKQWTGYLVDFSLEPGNQLSTDDFAGWLALQTNLALKGIIGIRAMAELAKLSGCDEDAEIYMNISTTYISRWEELGISRDKTHAKLAYDWYGSWTTIYNLYTDSLLCFHLPPEKLDASVGLRHGSDDQKPLKPPGSNAGGFVPKHIYKLESDWYHAVRQKYGLPLDSRHLYTKTDWEFFAMAVAAPSVRAEILQSVAQWVNETVTDRPFTDLHMTEGRGEFPGPNFFARPVVGGHFAFLALGRACRGQAMDGLNFLEESEVKEINVQDVLQDEVRQAQARLAYPNAEL